jgi:hypothetical protein
MNIVRLSFACASLLLVACRPPAPRPAPPADPLAWSPAYARGVLSLDLARMRRSPALDRWLRARGEGDCAARLSSRVRRLVVVSLDGGADAMGLVLAGDLPVAEVVACARARAPGTTVRTVTHRGVTLSRVTAGDDAAAEVDVLPQGIALIGPPWVARAMLDAGLSHAEGHGETAALRAEWDALPDGDLRGAWLPVAALRRSLGLHALRASAVTESSVRLTVTAVTPTDEDALRLAQRGVSWRDETAPTLQHAALRGLVTGLRLRADGRAVSATVSLDGAALDALWSALGALSTGL